MNPRERRILFVTCFGHFMSHVNMLVFPALVLPLAGRWGADMVEVLGISFWMYLLFGLTALPWGVAADRWGAKWLMGLFFLGASVSCVAAAMWIDAPGKLLLALAVLGIFTGIYHPIGLGWISRDVERVSLGLAYNGMFGNLGLATAPLLAGVVNWLLGPEAVYLAIAGLNLLGLVSLLAAPRAGVQGKKEEKPGEEDGMLGAFLILLVAMMLGGIVYRGATVVTPVYFELKNQGIFLWVSSFGEGLSRNVVATTITSIIYLVGIAGQYTGGRIAERFELRFSYLFFHALVVPVALLMSTAVDLPLVGLGMVYFFFLLGMQPIENTLVARFTPRRFHHAAYGTKFILTFGVGSLAVKMVEVIKGNASIEVVFWALGLISLLLVGMVLVLIARTPRMTS